MSRPFVFVTRQIGSAVLEKLAAMADVEVWPLSTPPPYETLCEKAVNASALITMLSDRIDASLMDAAPNLKIISQMAVGVDNIDVHHATQKGIVVGNTPGVLTETTADLAWALLMAVARRVVEAHNEVQQGIWRPWGPYVLCGQDLFGATLGVVGLGRIGQAVARRAAGFSMKVLYTNPRRNPEAEARLGAEYVTLDELLSRSDYISLHTYLSSQTRQMISHEQFARMKPNAILINTARGAVVDTAALIEALQQGKIAGAGLDVTDPEPINFDNPLLRMPNVVITPHIASAGTHTRERMAHMIVENVLAVFNNETIPYCANPEVYGHQ